jgi:phage tail-like protein
MAKFVVNSQRYDPYKNFKFRVSINGKPIGAVSEVSSLAKSVFKNSKRKLPGLQKFPNITMKRGVFKETKFYKWIAVLPGSKKFPVDIVIEQFDEKHKLVVAYHLTNAWLYKIEGPALKADGNEVLIESIELSHEGVELVKC